MKIIGLTSLVRRLVTNKCNLFIIIIFSVFSCYSVKNQQEKQFTQYDDLSKKYVYSFVEQMPSYKGGDIAFMADFGKSFYYNFQPNEDVQTKLRVQFVIDAKGNLIGARIYDKKAETLTNFEKAGLKALELLQSWNAGRHNNKNVNVIITKAINID